MPKILKKKKNNRVRRYEEGGEVGGLLDMLAQGSPSDDVASYAASVDPNLHLDQWGGLTPYLDPVKDRYLKQLTSQPITKENLLKALEEQEAQSEFSSKGRKKHRSSFQVPKNTEALLNALAEKEEYEGFRIGDIEKTDEKDIWHYDTKFRGHPDQNPYDYLSIDEIKSALDDESVAAIDSFLAKDPKVPGSGAHYDDKNELEEALASLHGGYEFEGTETLDEEGLNVGDRLLDRLWWDLEPHAKEISSIPLDAPAFEPGERGLEESSFSLPKGRESQLIMKPSDKTRTGQEPNYYAYWDKDKKQWKRRSVEKEEYDYYMRENRIRKPQIIKASF